MEEDNINEEDDVKKPEETKTPKDVEDKSKEDEEVKRLNDETTRINKAIAENENAKAREKAGGITTAGQQPEEPKELTDKEYKDKAMAGNL